MGNAKTCTILQCQAHKAATCPTKTKVNGADDCELGPVQTDPRVYFEYCGSSRYQCAARSVRCDFGVQHFWFAGTFLTVGSKLYVSL